MVRNRITPGYNDVHGGSEYSDEQLAWLKAMVKWQQEYGRWPDEAEVLRIAQALGYRKASHGSGEDTDRRSR